MDHQVDGATTASALEVIEITDARHAEHRTVPVPARAVDRIPDIAKERRNLVQRSQAHRVREIPKLLSPSSRHHAPSRRCPAEKRYRERKEEKGGSLLDADGGSKLDAY